jgi:hypothetical protein
VVIVMPLIRCASIFTLAFLCCHNSALGQLAGDHGIQVPQARRPATDCPTLEELGYEAKAITDIRLDISVDRGRLPVDCSHGLFAPAVGWEMASSRESEFSWAASELYHQPAYWDDPILERYGQARHPLVQPFLSGVHFFAMFPAIPYRIGMDRTHDRIYTLGYHRPGSPTPCVGRRLPWETDAAGIEAATWIALIFLLP